MKSLNVVIAAALTAMMVVLPASCEEQSNTSAQNSKSTTSGSLVGEGSKQTIGVTDREILIGSCIPVTGQFGDSSHEIIAAAKSYFAYVNDRGGLFGRKIKLTVCDDYYDPDKAIECYNTCLKDKVFASAFCIGSPSISKYLRMVELDKMPLLGICTGVPTAYDFRPSVFTFRPSYASEVQEQINQLWTNGIHKIALIYQADAAGAGVRQTVVKELHDRGASLAADVSFQRTGGSIDALLARIKEAHPEAVIVVGAQGTIDTIKARYEQKWLIPFFTYNVQRRYLLSTDWGEGVVATQVLPSHDENLPCAALYTKLLAKYSPSQKPSDRGFEGFMNARILVEGLQKAGHDLTRTRFIRAMESIHNLDLGLGPGYKVSYSHDNHNGLTLKSVQLTILHKGKYHQVTPRDWKEIVKRSKEGSK